MQSHHKKAVVTLALASLWVCGAIAGPFEDLSKAVHDATGLPTPHNPNLSVPDPIKTAKDHIDLAVSVLKATGCDQCAKDLAGLSASGQKTILDAANKYGYIIAPPGDLGGYLTLHMISSDLDNQLQIDTTNPPAPTAQTKTWSVTVDCLVQRASRFDAYSIAEIPGMSDMKDGDVINVTAKAVCPEYNIEAASKSVTSAQMVLNGEGINPRAKVGKELRYYLVGKTA